MNENRNSADPSIENLRLQYTEINTRSRWYASQSWQVPFAYIALVGLVAGSFKNNNEALRSVLQYASFLGAFIVIHLLAISQRIMSLVNELNDIEDKLSLGHNSKYLGWIHGSLLIFLIVVLITLFLASRHIVA